MENIRLFVAISNIHVLEFFKADRLAQTDVQKRLQTSPK